MNEISNDVFSEVYEFLKLLNKSYIEKIPEELRNLINEKRNKDYNPKYNSDMPIASQKISKQALSIITVINLDYWADEEEKGQINKILKQNSEIHQKKLREKYNMDEIFKNKKVYECIDEKQKSNNEAALKEYKKENFFRKILNKIKKFFS